MKKLALISALVLGLSGAAAMAADGPKEEGGHHKPKHGKMFEKMDANKDGVVSKAEADAFHEKKFGEMDANKDGSITKDEAEAHHKKKREERKQKEEDGKGKDD